MSRKQDSSGGAAERIRARLASTLSPEEAAAEPASPAAETAAREHFLGSVGQIAAGRSVERLPAGHIAPDVRPQHRQPRMLPLPEELAGAEAQTIYRELVAELRGLGQSLRERQIQPILVYPGESAAYPAARYLILVGQRRWTAAVLTGLETLDAIVVEPPDHITRLRLQYRENEDREDFSDMERAWTLAQLRTALGGDSVPMDEVAAQLGLRRARAYQLLRLFALEPAQQRQVALLRLQETQLRTLLDAFHRSQIDAQGVDAVLSRLALIAADRAHQAVVAADQPGAAQTLGPRQVGIDAPTVARLVARTLSAPLGAGADAGQPSDRRSVQLHTALARATAALQRSSGWVQTLDANALEELQRVLAQLRAALDHAAELLVPSAEAGEG
jgi:ParB/RepB/Spo0J family partition protein